MVKYSARPKLYCANLTAPMRDDGGNNDNDDNLRRLVLWWTTQNRCNIHHFLCRCCHCCCHRPLHLGHCRRSWWRHHRRLSFMLPPSPPRVGVFECTGLRRPPDNNTTTTNEKYADTMEGDHTGHEFWLGHEGSTIASILGQSSWEDVKKWNKIDEFAD